MNQIKAINKICYDGILMEYRLDMKLQIGCLWKTALLLFLLGLVIVPIQYSPLFPLIICPLIFLIWENDKRYNGYKLSEKVFIIYHDSFFHHNNVEFKIDDINSITYNYTRSQEPNTILYRTKKGNYVSYVPNGIFSFAKVLKYLKYEKGINIINGGLEDFEINLYLNNKIDKIPMENKY